MGYGDGATTEMRGRLASIGFYPVEAFFLAQAATLPPERRDPSVPPAVVDMVRATSILNTGLESLAGAHHAPSKARFARIFIWESVFGLGSWPDPIDTATLFRSEGVPLPPPRPAKAPPRIPGAAVLAPQRPAPPPQGAQNGPRDIFILFGVLGALAIVGLIAWSGAQNQSRSAAASSPATAAPRTTVPSVPRQTYSAPPTPRPAPTAYTPPAQDSREAQLRQAIQSSPGWTQYVDGVYFKWDEQQQQLYCPYGSYCTGASIEVIRSGGCATGTVSFSLLRNNTTIESETANFTSVYQGLPRFVHVLWKATPAAGDKGRLDSIVCNH